MVNEEYMRKCNYLKKEEIDEGVMYVIGENKNVKVNEMKIMKVGKKMWL